ncbi:hypothetical protein DFJ67_0171 [Asanoa ferruginea]|uniref:Uncharacterized protein n=1 Tax=Asanoa ferruginea TaxID=53367 RepID=A0A3D9ZAE1_9ACTN|nr:hypothetical protein [Asanoa ferruginea]REF94255.1 hypothetical protein DFJ67_0171 [Asanoa ferruginea]GIF49796.1 hypothetical protein Afe04nite_43350 [Asanoa ferruginea]
MPAANDNSAEQPGNRAARRAAKAGKQPGRELGRSSTKGGRSKPAAQPKNYAFRRA